MTDTQEMFEYWEGVQSYIDGQELIDNPYAHPTRQFEAWKKGHMQKWIADTDFHGLGEKAQNHLEDHD